MSHESEVLKMINTYADWGQKKVILEIVLDRQIEIPAAQTKEHKWIIPYSTKLEVISLKQCKIDQMEFTHIMLSSAKIRAEEYDKEIDKYYKKMSDRQV